MLRFIYIHVQIYISALRFIYPCSDIYIHAQIYISTSRFIYPRSDLYIHAQIYISTLRYIYPCSDLYIHAQIYISMPRFIFLCPATNQARAGELPPSSKHAYSTEPYITEPTIGPCRGTAPLIQTRPCRGTAPPHPNKYNPCRGTARPHPNTRYMHGRGQHPSAVLLSACQLGLFRPNLSIYYRVHGHVKTLSHILPPIISKPVGCMEQPMGQPPLSNPLACMCPTCHAGLPGNHALTQQVLTMHALCGQAPCMYACSHMHQPHPTLLDIQSESSAWLTLIYPR